MWPLLQNGYVWAKTAVVAVVMKNVCCMFKKECWLSKSAIYKFPMGSRTTDNEMCQHKFMGPKRVLEIFRARVCPKKKKKKGFGGAGMWKINRKRGWEIKGQGAVGHKFPCLATCTYYCRTLQGMPCRCVLWLCNSSSISGDKIQGEAPHSLKRALRYIREEQLNFPNTNHLKEQSRCGQWRWGGEWRQQEKGQLMGPSYHLGLAGTFPAQRVRNAVLRIWVRQGMHSRLHRRSLTNTLPQKGSCQTTTMQWDEWMEVDSFPALPHNKICYPMAFITQ